jgi:hypothetical protein
MASSLVFLEFRKSGISRRSLRESSLCQYPNPLYHGSLIRVGALLHLNKDFLELTWEPL